VTKKVNPRNAKLEEFTFQLREATRNEARPVPATPMKKLSKPPLHRYGFDKVENDRVPDLIGGKDLVLKRGAVCDDKGRLVLGGSRRAVFPPGLIDNLENVSIEMWFAATGDKYDWYKAIKFEHGGDGLFYCFRTRDVHRAEVMRHRHNEDIQVRVPVKKGRIMHVVITYRNDGKMAYYRDGKCYGTKHTRIALKPLNLGSGWVGPFEGIYDEVRIYDRVLSAEEVAGNYFEGPDKLNLAKDADADVRASEEPSRPLSPGLREHR
jgi:hypothetical protein